MKFALWFSILLSSAILTCFAANSTTKPEDYVVQLKVFLKEDKVPEYILDVLNNSLVEYDINVDDIITLTGLDLNNLDETIKVLRHFNISMEKGFSVNSLETVLNITKLPFKEFYDALQVQLNVSSESTRQSLSHLSINDTQFSEALTLRPENIYNILRNGSYTVENVEKALDVLNKTMPELYTKAKSIVLLQASKMSSTELMDSLKNLGLNRQIERELWTALQITSRDVYRSDKFRKILEEKSKKINEDIMLIAVLTGPNKLIMHKTLFDKLGNDVSESNDQVQVQPVQPASSDNSTKHNFVELDFRPATTKYVNISTNYTDVKNCSYVTFVNDVIKVEPIKIDANTTDGGIIARKNAGTVYNLGGPLICEGKLVGMASEEDGSRIFFHTFWRPHVVWHLASQNHSNNTVHGVHSGVESLRSLFLVNVAMIILVVFVKDLQN